MRLQLSHLLVEDTSRAGAGWGVFVKGGVSDGNPNPLASSVTGGIGGTGLFPSRPVDSFGVGRYFYGFSDDLASGVNPLVPLGDESRTELYYDFALRPGVHLGFDLQLLDPGNQSAGHAVVGGVRLNLRF